jgi:manganese transport system permease protein
MERRSHDRLADGTLPTPVQPARHPRRADDRLTNGYASAFVVLKKSALKVGSLSHALLPGIAVAILVAGLHDWSAFLGSLFAALLIGLGSLAVSRGSRLDQDSALAILYTAAFSGGIILLRRIGVTQEMEEWLFGNIMGLRDSDLWTNFWISFGALGTLTACTGRC